jgi:type II secretory pathway predicted ATPase ExeA
MPRKAVKPMFEEFYGFKETPFSMTIPTDKLYKDNDSDELIERLKYAAKRQLFAVMTGDSGTGKTTTLRRLRDELQNSAYTILYLSDSKLTPRGCYKGLLDRLGVESSYYCGEAKRQLHKEIESRDVAIDGFDERLWSATVESVTVNAYDGMTFLFKDSTEIQV